MHRALSLPLTAWGARFTFKIWCCDPMVGHPPGAFSRARPGRLGMQRTLTGLVLGLAVCASVLLVQDPVAGEEKKKGPQLERTDSSVDRSMTGHVEKVEVTDEHHGTLE